MPCQRKFPFAAAGAGAVRPYFMRVGRRFGSFFQWLRGAGCPGVAAARSPARRSEVPARRRVVAAAPERRRRPRRRSIEAVPSLRHRPVQRGPAAAQFVHEEIGGHDHQQRSAGARCGAHRDGAQCQFHGLAAAQGLGDFRAALVAVMHGFFAGLRYGQVGAQDLAAVELAFFSQRGRRGVAAELPPMAGEVQPVVQAEAAAAFFQPALRGGGSGTGRLAEVGGCGDAAGQGRFRGGARGGQFRLTCFPPSPPNLLVSSTMLSGLVRDRSVVSNMKLIACRPARGPPCWPPTCS